MPERPSSSSRSTRPSAHRPRLPREGGRARTTTSGRRTARRPRGVDARPASRGCSASTSPRSTAAPGVTRLPLQHGARRGDRPGPAPAGRASRCTPTSSCPTSPASAPTSRSSAGCPAASAARLITAIAMTEPGAGSDLQGIRTTRGRQGRPLRPQRLARRSSPTASMADLVIVVAPHRPRRRPHRASACWSSSAAWRASSAAATSTRSACTPRTPPSCSSTTSWCPRRTCSARRAAASST